MSIHEYSPSYEAAHRAILDEMPRAERKHPDDLIFDERWKAVHKELYEVREAMSRGDWAAAMKECVHTGVTLYRLMRSINQYTGEAIR